MRESLEVEGLSAGFGESRCLKEITVSIPCRKLTVILGPGASGKSTFLRILYGGDFEEPAFWMTGRVPVLDAAFMLQHKHRFACASGALTKSENVSNPVSAWEVGHPAVERLEATLARPCSTRSPAQRALLDFSRALAASSEWLLLDEPLCRMDEESRAWAVEALERCRGSNRGVVMVTHDLSAAARLADHAIFLLYGELVETGPAPGFFTDPRKPRTRQLLRTGA